MRKYTILIVLFAGFLAMLIAPLATGGENNAEENSFSKDVSYAFVRSYIQCNREALDNVRLRSRSPFAITDSVFHRYRLPVELKYLAVIESELKVNALSRVGAAGPWQLMPETAKILGLNVTKDNDERMQYAKSTKAAAIYLKDLYSEFGDWLLVLAAYNGGPGPVHRAMRKAGSSAFRDLQYYLPAESRMHVKKFIAAFCYFEGQRNAGAFTNAKTVTNAKALANTRTSAGTNASVFTTVRPSTPITVRPYTPGLKFLPKSAHPQKEKLDYLSELI